MAHFANKHFNMNNKKLQWHAAIEMADLDDEQPSQIKLGNIVIAICLLDGEVYAINDLCSHKSAYLSDGIIQGGCVICPYHLAQFDIKTGEPKTPPATIAVDIYPTRVDNGMVMVGIVK